jgi:hypothetical protein
MTRNFLISTVLFLCCTLPAFAIDPGTFDVIMQAGADYKLTLKLTDATAQPVNLTGYGYAAQFRPTTDAAAPVFATFSTAIPTPVSGQVEVKLSRRWTSTMAGKTGVWDLQQTDATGAVSYLLRGKTVVSPTVTR